MFNPAPGGGTSAEQQITVIAPVPATTSLSPATAVVGGAGFTLAVNGSNFDRSKPGSPAVRWNGVDRTVTYRGSSQLLVRISASDIAALGTVQATVVNLARGGDSVSNPATFTVIPVPPPTPTAIVANADQAAVSFGTGGTAIANLLANDRFNNLVATTASVQLTLLTALPAGTSFSTSTGRFTVQPGAESGDFPITYQICELASLSNCDTASLTLEISGSDD